MRPGFPRERGLWKDGGQTDSQMKGGNGHDQACLLAAKEMGASAQSTLVVENLCVRIPHRNIKRELEEEVQGIVKKAS